jgi:hypothetical protein
MPLEVEKSTRMGMEMSVDRSMSKVDSNLKFTIQNEIRRELSSFEIKLNQK